MRIVQIDATYKDNARVDNNPDTLDSLKLVDFISSIKLNYLIICVQHIFPCNKYTELIWHNQTIQINLITDNNN